MTSQREEREESNRYTAMVKTLLKNAGLLIILIGVIILALVVFAGTQTNASLALSLVLIIVGLLAHIVIGKMLE